VAMQLTPTDTHAWRDKMNRRRILSVFATISFFVTALFALTAASSVAFAQVPPDIAEGLRKIGPIINGPGTAKLYAPLFANQTEPYPNVTVVRDVAYGTDPLQKLDLFTAAPTPGAPMPVVVFIHGGGFERGDKRQPGSPFYDNIV